MKENRLRFDPLELQEVIDDVEKNWYKLMSRIFFQVLRWYSYSNKTYFYNQALKNHIKYHDYLTCDEFFYHHLFVYNFPESYCYVQIHKYGRQVSNEH